CGSRSIPRRGLWQRARAWSGLQGGAKGSELHVQRQKESKQMDASPESARHSWMLLGASFVTFLVSSACMQSYAVFLVAFIEEFGGTRGESSIAYSVSQLISGVTSP